MFADFHIGCNDLATPFARPIRLAMSYDELLLLVTFPARYTKLSNLFQCYIANGEPDHLILFRDPLCLCSVLAALMWSPSLLPSRLIFLTMSCRLILDSASVAMSSAKRRLSDGDNTHPWSTPMSVRNQSVNSPSTRTALNIASYRRSRRLTIFSGYITFSLVLNTVLDVQMQFLL